MMDWVGPVLYEYYGGTEGTCSMISPAEWLKKPGSVGRPIPGITVEIRDEEHQKVSVGEIGTVYINAPNSPRFSYHKDEAKTESAYYGDAFTMGDMGYLDEDSYLFLTGRSAEVIISGGVNIYPAETDAALLAHSAVADVATVGIPNPEWGEEVRSVVQLKPGVEASDELAAQLIAFTRLKIAHFKCPRSVEFDPALPRRDDGKVLRRLVRERYWD
jgi:long-chain acyl-CoA synthetase